MLVCFRSSIGRWRMTPWRFPSRLWSSWMKFQNDFLPLDRIVHFSKTLPNLLLWFSWLLPTPVRFTLTSKTTDWILVLLGENGDSQTHPLFILDILFGCSIWDLLHIQWAPCNHLLRSWYLFAIGPGEKRITQKYVTPWISDVKGLPHLQTACRWSKIGSRHGTPWWLAGLILAGNRCHAMWFGRKVSATSFFYFPPHGKAIWTETCFFIHCVDSMPCHAMHWGHFSWRWLIDNIFQKFCLCNLSSLEHISNDWLSTSSQKRAFPLWYTSRLVVLQALGGKRGLDQGIHKSKRHRIRSDVGFRVGFGNRMGSNSSIHHVSG